MALGIKRGALWYVGAVETTGFKFSLQAKVVESTVNALWWTLERRIKLEYRIELVRLSQANARAEWLLEQSLGTRLVNHRQGSSL